MTIGIQPNMASSHINQIKNENNLTSFVGYQPKSSQLQRDDYYDEEELDQGLNELECNLLGERAPTSASKSSAINTNNAAFGKNANFSTRVQNDITRSEKKSEKRPNYYGRDDRATSEQVLDPRTRLILFKLLSSGYMSEIDGKHSLSLVYILYCLIPIDTLYVYTVLYIHCTTLKHMCTSLHYTEQY